MHIMAQNGMFHLMWMGGAFSAKPTDDGGLEVWQSDAKFNVVVVSTGYDTFLEVVDGSGGVLQEGGGGAYLDVRLSAEPVRLRFKALADPMLSASEMEAERKTVRRILVSDMPYSLDIPRRLTDAIAWLENKLLEIPEACRASASLDLDTSREYGETYPNCEIAYDEPETDAEVIKRVQIAREQSRLAEKAERRKFDALKAKFEAAS